LILSAYIIDRFLFVQVDPTKQQDEHWLFGQIDNDKQGFFPVAYTELIT
jgi:hypothetical protein